jgi:uncharacterized secreted protein with C-terminal beta-propeller domain
MKRTQFSKIALIAGLVVGCSGSNAALPDQGEGGGGSLPETGGEVDVDGIDGKFQGALPEGTEDEFLTSYRPSAARAALTRVDSCDALLTSIQNDFLVRVAQTAAQLKKDVAAQANGTAGSGNVYYDPGFGAAGAIGVPGMATGGSSFGPVASGGAGGASSGGWVSGSAGSGVMVDPSAPMAGPEPSSSGPIADDDSEFSGTNNQVVDVDEADIVKGDGDRLYLIHGNNLAVLHAWPAAESTLIGSLVLEGNPRDLFIRGEHAVVFSDIWDPWSAGLVTDPYGYYSVATKVTVLNVSGEVPSVERELYLEGSYISSRRHDDVVRTVVQNGARSPQVPYPYLEYYDLFGNPYPTEVLQNQVDEWFVRIVNAVRNSDIGDWLSREWVREDGTLTQLPPRCEDYYVPDPGVTRPGVTNVISFDLSATTLELHGASIFGMAERVYANSEAVILASYDTRYDSHGIAGEQTLLHRFTLDGANTAYQASGFVPGHIHNQFSLDEQDNIVRVSTTERRWDGFDEANPWNWVPPEPVNRVLTLERNDNELVILGQAEEFAYNEEIYSTRFIGDRGYVVTFRQTDPFFVIDLSDPADPHLVGELKIPGFSEYLHPLDANHLLALGRDSEQVEGGFIDLGQALQIFDVTDPTAPELAHKFVFEGGASSQANVDHHAIAFHPEQNLIAFPLTAYYPSYRNSLEVFRVDGATGFEQVGSISNVIPDEECFATLGYDPNWLSCYAEADREIIMNDWRNQCTGYAYFKRGVFRGEAVYAISNVDVGVYDLADTTTAVASVVLPPEYGYYQSSGDPTVYYGMGGTSPGYAAGGSAGAYYETAGAAGAYAVYNPYGCGGAGGAGGDGSMMGIAGGTSAGGTSAGGAGGSSASP